MSDNPLNYGYLPGYKDLVAAGSSQEAAALVRGGVNVYTDVPVGSGVVLPQSYSANTLIAIFNFGANALSVYPAYGAEINQLGVNAPVLIAPSSWAIFSCVDSPMQPGQQWWVITPTPPNASLNSLAVSGSVSMTGLPTSATGLSSGAIYVNGGILCVA